MTDNTTLNSGAGGDVIASDDIGGVKHQRVKIEIGVDGVATDVSATTPLPVSDNGGSLTVDGTVTAAGPLTDAQLRASAPAVDTELTTSDLDTGAGTDTRAVAGVVVPGSGGGVLMSQPLTDTQIRAAALPVSGTVTANAGAGPYPVSDNAGSLTVDNGGTFAVQDSQKVADNAAFVDGTTPVETAGYIFDEVAGTALTENDAAAARIDSKRAQVGVLEDATTRGQRAAVSAANALKVDGSAVTQPVSGTVTANLPAGTNNIGDVDVLTLPTLPAGTNNIGDVDVLTLPTLPAGTNNIGDVDVLTEPGSVADNAVGLPAVVKVVAGYDGTNVQAVTTNAAGNLQVGLSAALPAGVNNIGGVDVLTLPALPAGANNIGDVDVLTLPVATVRSDFPAAVTGTLVAANTPVVAPVSGYSGASVMISGTYGGFNLVFQQSNDGGVVYSNATATVTAAGAGQIEQQILWVNSNDIQHFAITLMPGATHLKVFGFGGGPPTGTANIRIAAGAFTRPNAQVVRHDANTEIRLRTAPLIVSATAAIGAAVTATLPAAGVNLFHHITRVNIFKYAGVAVAGAAAPVVVTTTNLPGALAWSTPTAMAVGTSYETDVESTNPIRSSVANTATTIVAPLTASVIWRINVFYYTAS